MDWHVGGGAQRYWSQNLFSNIKLPVSESAAEEKLMCRVCILEVYFLSFILLFLKFSAPVTLVCTKTLLYFVKWRCADLCNQKSSTVNKQGKERDRRQLLYSAYCFTW